MTLRIGLFGNVANSLLQLGRALRAHTDFDVHLFIRGDEERIRRPDSDYRELSGRLPDWIHEGHFGLSASAIAAPWLSPMVREMRNHYFVIANGHAPMFAQFGKRPWA